MLLYSSISHTYILEFCFCVHQCQMLLVISIYQVSNVFDTINILPNRHCVYSVGGFNSIVMNSGKACVMKKTHTIYVMSPLFVLYLSYLNRTRKMNCLMV